MSTQEEILEKISDEDFFQEDYTDQWTPHKISKLWKVDSKFNSPINLDVTKATQIELPSLVWNEYDEMPKKIKITNTGSTLIISAKWSKIRPYITGGPLLGKYILSQIHFHWGKTPFEGSEHTVDDMCYPLEMHAVHFKSSYKTQQEALKYPDGLITVAYLFQLKAQQSSALYPIVSKFPNIRLADTAITLEPFIISQLIFPFSSDYYLYWGNVNTEVCDSQMLWLITRDTSHISYEQLKMFHLLLDSKLRPILRNFRTTFSFPERNFFHVNPRFVNTFSTLLIIPIQLDWENAECPHEETPVLENK